METNSDLAFAKVRAQESLPVRCILDCFPCSQHRPSLITTLSLIQPTRRETSSQLELPEGQLARILQREVDVTAGTLPVTTAKNIDKAYCKLLLDVAKKHIPRGCRANTSHAGTTSVKICCVPTQKQYQVRKEYQQPQTSSPGSTTNIKRGGQKWSSQLTSPTQANEHGRPSTS